MRDAPSAELIELLARLQLATPQQVRAVRSYAQSLARDLPLFDSVWVDALMRRRILTPFQAAEINAGRGAELELGSVVLQHPPERIGYANQYLARVRNSGEQVRVVVAALSQGTWNTTASEKLNSTAEQLQRARQAETALGVQPILESGVCENKLWIVQPFQNDISLREWMLRGGRLSAEFVLEIARHMAAELAALEKFSILHGDISSASIRIRETGRVSLSWVGLRNVVRPREGYAHADLSPESYDYLAPERISTGTTANLHSDLYACGCLWWQLLTGRAPLPGGDSLAKIKAAHAARITPLSRLAPETPAHLMSIINQLLQPNPNDRGESFSALAEELGPASPAVQQRLADCYREFHPWTNKQSDAVASNRSQEIPSLAKLIGDQTWFDSAWNMPWNYSRGAAISTALACSLLVALAAWFFWPTAKHEESESIAHHSSASEPPGILSTTQTAGGKPISGQDGNSVQNESSGVRTVSNTSDSSDQVTTAVHTEIEQSESAEDPSRSMKVVRKIVPVREILLPSDRVVQASSLELHVGMRLAPAAGSRARVQVPEDGWNIDLEDVRFENIDFILPSTTEARQGGQTYIVLKASSAQFHSCTFQAEGAQNNSAARSSAIRWIGAAQTETLDRLPAAGHLLLANCFLANIHTGVDGRIAGPMLLELDNVLFAAPSEAANSGSLWRIENAPANEDTFVLRMNACTVRDAMSLVDIYCPALPSEPGKINIETIDCVFSLRSSGALLRMIGPYKPDRLVRSIAWSGRGSLLPVQGRFGLWYDAQGSPHPIDDTGVEIDGLVRGGVEFAGEVSSKPQDSALTHWAAPLIGDVQPGVRVSALPGDARN